MRYPLVRERCPQVMRAFYTLEMLDAPLLVIGSQLRDTSNLK